MNEVWAGLIQSLLWYFLVVAILWNIRSKLPALVEAVLQRVGQGAAFQVGGFFSMEAPPEAILTNMQAGLAVLGEGVGGVKTPEELADTLRSRKYPDGITDRVFLLHDWEIIRQSSGKKDGLYRIRIWVESYDDSLFTNVKRVTYRLPKTFSDDIISTELAKSNFELWINCWGEFSILAYIELSDGKFIWLNRHLTLPSRPKG